MAVCAAALPINLLVDYGYSLLSIEVLAVALGLGVLGAALGALTVRSFLYSYFLALLVYFFVEIYFLSWTVAQITVSFVVLLGITLLLRFTGTRLLPYFIAFAAAFSLSAVSKPAIPVLAETGVRPELPGSQQQSLLHIVLDELASPYNSVFPPAQGHPAQRLFPDLVAQGFHIDANAYSVAAETVKSLSALVALEPDSTAFQAFNPGAIIANSVSDNRYARTLRDAGYEVFILQSSYLDYCLGLENVHCQTYSRTGRVNELSSAGLSERLKLAIMLLNEGLTSNTRSGVLLYALLLSLTDVANPVLDFSVPLISHDLLQGEVMEQVAAIKPGEVHYLHLLLPHFPYLYSPDCERLPIGTWGYPVRHAPALSAAQSYAMYWDQVACAGKLLSAVLAATADKDYLTTLVHGDHGARILWQTGQENEEDNLKTFVAVRSPQIEPGLSSQPVILQQAVIQYLESLF